MDACLDTLSDELCQVNTRVGHIAQRQAEMGGYTMRSTPMAPTNESDTDDVNDDDDATASEDDADGDASSSGTDEMFTWYSYPLSLVTKRGSSFGYKSSHT